MKPNTAIRTLTSALLAVAIAGPLQAQQKSFFEQAGSEAKYTPGDFKPAPEKIMTRYGNLEFPGGYPTEETAQKVYDELDLQRATQLYLDMYPALPPRNIHTHERAREAMVSGACRREIEFIHQQERKI